jgi:hypothetical protein
MRKEETAPAPSPRLALLVGALLILALERLVPMGQLVLYPFTLLSTWVHEMGHGVTALLLGGEFTRLNIFADASGIALFKVVPGVRQALAAAGGLIGPPLIGAVCLLLARRASRLLLYLLAGAMLLSLPLWVRTSVGWASVGGLGLAIALLARVLSDGGRLFFAQLIGLLLAFDTLSRGDYLFMRSARVGGATQLSDVAAIANVMGGPIWLWGGVVALISAFLLGIGLYSVLSRGPKRVAMEE